MDPIRLEDPASGSDALIVPDRGFNCIRFRAVLAGRVIDVLDADPAFADGAGRPSGHGIPILFPFPNRIRGGRFQWQGRPFELSPDRVPFDQTGNAIHGLCLDRPWRVVDCTTSAAVASFQLSVEAPDRLTCWPGDVVLDVGYTLRGALLRADVRIANPGDDPLPWGFGTHPYFRLPLAAGSEFGQCLVEVPAARFWPLENCLPIGSPQLLDTHRDLRQAASLEGRPLDDVLTELTFHGAVAECHVLDPFAGLQITQRFDRSFRELVVFTPPGRNAVCLEPYTCVTDAINLQPQGLAAGLRTLGPGQEVRLAIEIEATEIVA